MRVKPHGFEDIEHSTDKIYLSIRWDGFSLRDKTDHYNEMRAIPHWKGKLTSIKKFRAWYMKNRHRVETMSFDEIVSGAGEAGASIHTWC